MLKNQLVIFAYGNPSRGDDALGPMLLELVESENIRDDIMLLTDFQLQVEHVVDLENCQLALFIDASVDCLQAFCFQLLYPQKDDSYTSHAMHPSALLYAYQQIYQIVPPPTFLLSVQGESFELGDALSVSAKQHLEAAFQFLQVLLPQIETQIWQNHVTT